MSQNAQGGGLTPFTFMNLLAAQVSSCAELNCAASLLHENRQCSAVTAAMARNLALGRRWEEVQVTQQDKVVARVVPAKPSLQPDFLGRAKAIWGEQPPGKPSVRSLPKRAEASCDLSRYGLFR